jgi:hypothetical protein
MQESVTALIFAGIGVALKTLWDSYFKRREAVDLESWRIRASQLEKKLANFYWPVYIRLQRDNTVWEKILERSNKQDEERSKLAYQIEEDVLLPNHMRTVEIVESNIHLAGLDSELEELLMQYLRHVAVYRSIRTVGIKDKDPIHFGEPWPLNLFEAIQKRLVKYQKEYDELLRGKGIL